MGIPFVIVAGLGITLAAKTVSWIYDALTEEEQEKQTYERKRVDEIRSRAKAAFDRKDAETLKIVRESALENANALRRVIKDRRLALQDVPDDLRMLEEILLKEASDRTSSPWRKSALRREYARIEDAAVRLKEYQCYLDHEQTRIDNLLALESWEEILSLDSVDQKLPLEWLYPGKLVLVTLDEVNKTLPRFRHSIVFARKLSAAQRALALQYGDEVPILIQHAVSQSDGKFIGCVARGALYYHNIMQDEPADFVIERVIRGKLAIGTLYQGLLNAILPISQLKYPSIRPLLGQKFSVYPTLYNLCLSRNPFDAKSSSIEVSEFNYSERNTHTYQQIYLVAERNQFETVTDHRFFESSENWTLLDYSSGTGIITLARGTVCVECLPSNDFEWLTVTSVIQTDSLKIGIDMPFRLTLLERTLADQARMGWVPGVEELIRFCTQSMLDAGRSPERLAQSKFYQQWEKVIQYQRSKEELFTFDFPLLAAHRDGDVLTLMADSSDPESIESFAVITDKLKNVLSESNKLNADHLVSLLQWEFERSVYVPVLKRDRRSGILYNPTSTKIMLEGDLQLPEGEGAMLRLQVKIPSAALKRQDQALEDFFNDRLVNPLLKNILLAPENYIPQQDKLAAPLCWSDQLDESQKRVVELCLRERNIALIQGPPGAGKTTAIVEMMYQLFKQNHNRRILIVSQQNSAVDNALEKFLASCSQTFGSDLHSIRIGNASKIAASILPVSFDTQYDAYLKHLESRATMAAVTLPKEEVALCHKWRASLTQASQTRSEQDELFITLLANRNLVGATCVGLATNKGGIDRLSFDIAIIDEAGRSTVPEILIPIMRSQKVIMVGDHFQLPPSIAPLLREDEATEEMAFLKENFLETSFFELMFNALPSTCKEVLDRQYRMAPTIGNLVGRLFYSPDGKRTLYNDRSEDAFSDRYLLKESLYWVDVKGRQHTPKNSTSYENDAEAIAIVRFLTDLANRVSAEISVAVITPYGGQKQKIREYLRKAKWLDGKMGSLMIAVDTVDAFQGSEADVVCYSTVRTHGNLNFILDRKRLNVACSRARLHLLFFGDKSFLQNWKAKKGRGVNLYQEIIQSSSPTDDLKTLYAFD